MDSKSSKTKVATEFSRVWINGEWLAMGPTGYEAGQVVAGTYYRSQMTLGRRVHRIESDPDGAYVPGLALYKIANEIYLGSGR